MRKVIKYSERDQFIRSCIKTICTLRDQELSDSELSVMVLLIKYSNNNSVNLDVHLARQIREELKIGQSLLGTCINRIERKKYIRKDGKVIMIDPTFNNIGEWGELVIRLDSARG